MYNKFEGILMRYNIYFNINDFDKYGLKLYAYPALLSQLGYEHLKNTDQGVGVLIKNKYAWVIISMKLRISQKISKPCDITGVTWYSGRKGPYFRREYEITNKNFQIIGSSYSVLIDVITRKIYRNSILPFKIIDEKDKYLLTLEANYRDEVNSEMICSRKVLNSHIDVLGHVNHLKYVEFIYDSLTEEEINEVNSYNTLELFFHNEMLLGEEFSINKGQSNNKTIFTVINQTKNSKAFTLVLSNE